MCGDTFTYHIERISCKFRNQYMCNPVYHIKCLYCQLLISSIVISGNTTLFSNRVRVKMLRTTTNIKIFMNF